MGIKQRAFTLIELMVAIAVLAILVALAIPSFTQIIQNHRISTLASNLNSAATFARAEAIKRSRRVTICRSNAAKSGCQAGAGNWSSGWLIFVDEAGSDTASPVYAAAQLIRMSDSLPVGTQVVGSLGDTVQPWVSFNSLGVLARASSSADSYSFQLSVPNSSVPSKTLQIGLAGRANICQGMACE